MKFMVTLRDSWMNLHHWVNHFCNSNASSPPKGSKLERDHRKRIEKKKEKKFKDSELFKKEKKQLPVYFRISKKINTKQRQFKDSWRSKSNLRIKPG